MEIYSSGEEFGNTLILDGTDSDGTDEYVDFTRR